MYYELYIDSLFLINFCMNLFLLLLVNSQNMRTATRTRLVLGALAGTAAYLIPFLIDGIGWLKLLVFFPIGMAAMIKITFQVKSVRAFCRIAEKMVLNTFLMGGVLLFVIRSFPGIREILSGTAGIVTAGALAAVLFLRRPAGKKQNFCKVVLIGAGARLTVNALLDTGNGLIEPISGKPVSILERSVFDKLWKEEKPGGFRAIPYHSIGKSRGILYGYLLPEILVEVDGVTKPCKNVYIGVSEGMIAKETNYKMILNPGLIEG